MGGCFADASFGHRNHRNCLASGRKELDLVSRRSARAPRVKLNDHTDVPGANTLPREIGREYDAREEDESHSLP